MVHWVRMIGPFVFIKISLINSGWSSARLKKPSSDHFGQGQMKTWTLCLCRTVIARRSHLRTARQSFCRWRDPGQLHEYSSASCCWECRTSWKGSSNLFASYPLLYLELISQPYLSLQACRDLSSSGLLIHPVGFQYRVKKNCHANHFKNQFGSLSQ